MTGNLDDPAAGRKWYPAPDPGYVGPNIVDRDRAVDELRSIDVLWHDAEMHVLCRLQTAANRREVDDAALGALCRMWLVALDVRQQERRNQPPSPDLRLLKRGRMLDR